MFTYFPSIESLRHVVKGVGLYCQATNSPVPTINYLGTVKLHGTNAGIHLAAGSNSLSAFSRTRQLSVDDDNYGFAKHVAKSESELVKLFRHVFGSQYNVDIYGEWCGQGVQDGVALSKLQRHFVIFSVRFEGGKLRNIADGGFNIKDVEQELNALGVYHIGQVPTYHVTIDFNNPDANTNYLEQVTEDVERECPWGKLFGVSGVGEGIVWTPLNDFPESVSFKTKGLLHKKKSDKPKVEVAPEVANSLNELSEKILPEWRMEQGIKEVCGEAGPDKSKIGQYLIWLSNDVLKEEKDVIEANNVEWKALWAVASKRGREYMLRKIGVM